MSLERFADAGRAAISLNLRWGRIATGRATDNDREVVHLMAGELRHLACRDLTFGLAEPELFSTLEGRLVLLKVASEQSDKLALEFLLDLAGQMSTAVVSEKHPNVSEIQQFQRFLRQVHALAEEVTITEWCGDPVADFIELLYEEKS